MVALNVVVIDIVVTHVVVLWQLGGTNSMVSSLQYLLKLLLVVVLRTSPVHSELYLEV